MKNEYLKYTILAFVLISIFVLWFTGRGTTDNQTILDQTKLEQVSIVLTESGFEPRYVKINLGTTITFTSVLNNPFWPASNLHPSHGIYREFDPRTPLTPDEGWSFTFDKIGTSGFHDHIRSYFTGIIYVE